MVGTKRRAIVVCFAIVSHFAYYLHIQSALRSPARSLRDACNDNNIIGNSTKYRSNHSYPGLENQDISQSSAAAKELRHTNNLLHDAEFGLGHRLTKMSSAWHLTKALNLTRMEFRWVSCAGYPSIFPRLFGSSFIDVPGTEEAAVTANAAGNVNKTVVIVNDVSGYYSGKNYKHHKVEFPHNSPFLDKLESDLEFYKLLRAKFNGRRNVTKFMQEYRFKEHFVIGLHLRLGNGEEFHFVESGRNVSNEYEFTYNLIDLIRSFLEKVEKTHPERFRNEYEREGGCLPYHKRKTPLLFLATDSPKFIPIIGNMTQSFGVETIVFPQLRLESGVTLSLSKKGKKCIHGWQCMIFDQILLSYSDVLIAARPSTFTQTLPMSLVFDHGDSRSNSGPHFCEVSDSALTMVCLEDVRTWLFREDTSKMFTYWISSVIPMESVNHDLSVHLPDNIVSNEQSRAEKFLLNQSETGKFHYRGEGQVFDPKYRNEAPCPKCEEFTFI